MLHHPCINQLYAAAAKLFQSCPTLLDPIDGSPPGSTVTGTLQARTLECVAISFSKAWKWKVKGKSLSRVQLLATPWTAAHQAPPSMGFSRQEYWSGVPLPSPNQHDFHANKNMCHENTDRIIMMEINSLMMEPKGQWSWFKEKLKKEWLYSPSREANWKKKAGLESKLIIVL